MGLGGSLSLSPVPCPPANSGPAPPAPSPAPAALPPPSLPPPYSTATLQVRYFAHVCIISRKKQDQKQEKRDGKMFFRKDGSFVCLDLSFVKTVECHSFTPSNLVTNIRSFTPFKLVTTNCSITP